MASAAGFEALQPGHARGVEAAFTLDRLDDHRGDFAQLTVGPEHRVEHFDGVGIAHLAVIGDGRGVLEGDAGGLPLVWGWR